MKKLLLSISAVFLVLFGAMTISASAARYTSLPITINQNRYGTTSMFTLTDFEVYVSLNETPKYTKTADIYVAGDFNQGSRLDLSFYCYDASGNHIGSYSHIIYASDFEEYDDGTWAHVGLNIPDVAATIELGTAFPGSWSNTYFYCKYMNVHSADGRSLGIHDILLPVYENCGWYGPVTMYALDGREIEVPYNKVSSYQNVGWYLWEDYYYKVLFKDYYDRYMAEGDYNSAFDEIDWAIDTLVGTHYEKGLYTLKTQLMDTWRKKINCPLAYCWHEVDKSNGDLEIGFRNVSYKEITAFKIQFECYDTFSDRIYDSNSYYYCDDAQLLSGEYASWEWEGTPYDTDYVRNIRVTQVVFSDGTSWYR